VRGKIEAQFADMGEQSLKNIARPLRVYRIGPSPAPDQATTPPSVLPLPDKPSIAVLPFANLSGDPEQEYFADGMVEEIITALSRIRWLFVIARNSTFTYKGQAIDVKQVGRELGVRYVLEGSVRKAGGRVRITAQLIDAFSGTHLWADRFDSALERYDCDLANIFAVQYEITEAVTIAITPAIDAAEQQRVLRSRLGASTPGVPISVGYGIFIMSVRRTTRSHRSSFSKPLISTRALPEATRASVRFKATRLTMRGAAYPRR
jgi:adenylate cyclase